MADLSPRPDSTHETMAAMGLSLAAVAGAMVLARFGAPEADADGHEELATLPIG